MSRVFLNQRLVTIAKFGPTSENKLEIEAKKEDLEDKHKEQLLISDSQTRKNLNKSSYNDFLKNKKVVNELLQEALAKNQKQLEDLKHSTKEELQVKEELENMNAQLTTLESKLDNIKDNDSALRNAIFSIERMRRNSIQVLQEVSPTIIKKSHNTIKVKNNILENFSFFGYTKIGLALLWPLIIAVLLAGVTIAVGIIYGLK